MKWLVQLTAAALGALLVGVGLGVFASGFFSSAGSACTSQYTYINPEPDCDTFDERSSRLDALQEKLDAKVKNLELQPNVDHVAVFTRDLVTRRFAGVNDVHSFYMASLLKVPILIAYYKFAEVEPKILDDGITYDGSINEYDLQDIPVPDHLVVGKSYTVSELLYHSVANSDNTAAQILMQRLPSDFLDKVLTALGTQFQKPEGEKEDLITARSYAGVFRVLYNASYLSREYSNKALELLTHTSFDKGAAAGIPAGTAIAHKYGERANVDPKTDAVVSRQLHDCGIIYAHSGSHPYIFCIMTQGNDFSALQSAIRDLSATIYNALEE